MFSNRASVQPLGKTNSSGKLQPANCKHFKKLMIGSLGASLGGRFLSGKVTCILLALNKPSLTMVLLWSPVATLFLCLSALTGSTCAVPAAEAAALPSLTTEGRGLNLDLRKDS